MNNKLMIIGSSKIAEEHIKCAIKAGFKLYSLNSSRLHSKNENRLYKFFKFQTRFPNWRVALKDAFKDPTISIFLAPKYSENIKILKYALKGNNFVFIEKPLTSNIKDLIKLQKYKKRIFIAYNRIFYKNIRYIKKNLTNATSVIVKFTDSSKKNILLNSIHIISIIHYLFGDLKIQYSQRKKKFVNILATNKNGLSIFFIYSDKFPETYSIDIRCRNKRYFVKPLEKMQIIKKLSLKYKNNNKKMLIPFEEVHKNIDLYKNSNFKAGFLEQMQYFYQKLNKGKKFGNLDFGIKVMKFALNFVK